MACLDTMSKVNGTNDANAPGIAHTEVELSVALAPNDLKSVPGLIHNINSIAERASAGNENERLMLVEMARSLVQALETPRETMIKHCWAQVSGQTFLVFQRTIG